MWISATDGGRINLDQSVSLLVSGSGSVWAVNAHLTDGSSVKVSGDFATKSEADDFADSLILDGS